MMSHKSDSIGIVVLFVDQARLATAWPLRKAREKTFVRTAEEVPELRHVVEVIFVISRFSTCSTQFVEMVTKSLALCGNLKATSTYFLDEIEIPAGLSDLEGLPRFNRVDAASDEQ